MALPLVGGGIDKLAPRPLSGSCGPQLTLLKGNGVLIVDGSLGGVFVTSSDSLVEVGGVLGVFKEETN